jgi:TonB-linked SusC/RagA family outer membrane protein
MRTDHVLAEMSNNRQGELNARTAANFAAARTARNVRLLTYRELISTLCSKLLSQLISSVCRPCEDPQDEGATMNDMLQGKGWFGNGHRHVLRAVGVGLLFVLVVCRPAVGLQGPQSQRSENIDVSGVVTNSRGAPLPGVTVQIRGTENRTTTDATGKYSLTAPADGALTFTLIGYRGRGQPISGKSSINVVMEDAIATLPDVVVTGYTSQRRQDITGAVATVNVESVERQSSTSVLQRLDGRVAGVTVDNSGSPGSRTTVRVRGISSFQNNDPLYIVDGTPISDSYLNFLNPADIGEIQVLKDASAASIYGARANNGVVIIETKKGRPGARHISLDVRTGVSSPYRGYDDFLIQDPMQYYQVVKRSYLDPGTATGLTKLTDPAAYPANIYGTDPNNPSLPAYIWPACRNPCTSVDPTTYSYPNSLIMPASTGTNWWKAVFSPANYTDANLAVAGGGEDHVYNLSFNYLRQGGTAAYNQLQRGGIRLNTTYTIGRFVVGENVTVSREQHYGGISDDPTGYAEDGILGKNIMMQPIIPVYDIGNGFFGGPYFAGGKATGLGNQSNPLAYAWWRKDDRSTNDRLFGNAFAGVDLLRQLSFKTRFSFNLFSQTFLGYTPTTPENAEPLTSNSINEQDRSSTDWDWSNTLNYARSFGQHNLTVLAGQAVSQNTNRFLTASINNLLNTAPDTRYIQDALGAAATKNVSSEGGLSRLLSFFGKADYNFAEKYYASVTVRRDGSSNLGPNNQWGTFPAFNVGWRLSQEPFLAHNTFFSNVMLRFGWGKTGNQFIPSGRIVSQFGGSLGDTFYDIAGGGSSVQPGFKQTRLGNTGLKWEENKSWNLGADISAFQGKGNLAFDYYERTTSNLLFDPPNPATAGTASPAIANIGSMRNAGVDFSISYQGTLGEQTLYSVTFNGSHYINRILSIDGSHTFFYGPISTRYGNQVINQVGNSIGSFFGLITDGYFTSAADAAAHTADVNGVCATPPCQDGAAMGRIKFKDVNGDGKITLADRTVIGSPHPDFTAGLDLTVRHGAFDVSATLFGTFGNKIFDVQKEWYVFRNFNTNVRTDLLTDSWTPSNLNAKYPILDVNDNFSHAISSFYVEDGSYVRLRNLQIGYTVPPGLIAWLPSGRVYLQVENLFTITGYNGLDPSLPAANIYGAAGDIRDQYRGIDRGTYPTSRTFTVGINTTF